MQDIKAARIKQGFSHAQLAQRAKVSKLTLINIESGKHSPGLTTYLAIVGALGYRLEWVAMSEETEHKATVNNTSTIEMVKPVEPPEPQPIVAPVVEARQTQPTPSKYDEYRLKLAREALAKAEKKGK